jgi:hypothetical protein
VTWYAIYKRVENRGQSDIEVKYGFSYPAFFFTWVWALSKRLYAVAFVSFLFGPLTPLSIVFCILSVMPPMLWVPTGSKNLESFVVNAVPLLSAWTVQVTMGFCGNVMYRKKLKKSSFICTTAVCRNRSISQCYKPHIFRQIVIFAKSMNYSGLVPGVLLSVVVLWLAVHDLFPVG